MHPTVHTLLLLKNEKIANDWTQMKLAGKVVDGSKCGSLQVKGLKYFRYKPEMSCSVVLRAHLHGALTETLLSQTAKCGAPRRFLIVSQRSRPSA